MSKKNKRQLPIISQSQTIFSTRQQARIIRNEALQMIEAANEFTTNTRRVNRRSAFRVISRSLHSSEGLPFSVRKHQALTELSNYIALAKHNKVVGLTAFNTDLLPLSHPRSTRPHSMTASAMIRSHVKWITDDPRITDESAKALIASAMLAPANSPEKLYAITRLENLPQGHVPLEAITAAYGGGNSAAAKRARVALQLRDRLGRWVEMFGGLGIKVKRRDGSTSALTGRAVGQNIFSPALADVELNDGRIVALPIRQARGGTFLPSEESRKDGFTKSGSTADDMSDPIIDEADLTFMESPSSFEKASSGQGVTRYTDQAYDVVKFDDNKRALADLTESNKIRAEKDLDNAAVDKQGETDPDSGKQFWDPSRPIYAVSRRGGTPFAYTQSWNDAQQRIAADQRFLDEEEGRTPLARIVQDDNTPEDETPLVDQQDKFKKEEVARLPEPEEGAEAPAGFAYKVPEDTYEVTNPKAPYRSVSEYDDPASLANMFQGDELIDGLDDSLDTGLGRLQFPEEGEDRGGEQEVPAEAILKAIDEKGGDAELALAQAYDKRLGTSENEDALYAKRETDREGKIGEPKKLGEVFDEVTEAPEPETEAPVEETPVAELPQITEDEEPMSLPPALEGLTLEEQADFLEDKDYSKYMSQDEPVDWPEDFTAPQDRELTPLEREQAINLANSDVPDEDLVTSYNGAIKNQYDEDGYAPFSELDENNEEQVTQVASEVLRDAMKLRNFDMDETNQQILDGNWDEVDEEDEVALEEEAPAAETPAARIPDEGKGTKLGKDPLKEGWTPEEWIYSGSKDPRFHDMLKKNKDFTRLAAFYNDPTFDSPLMSDYQDKEMDGFESGSEVEAIDIGERGFTPSPAGRVKYALDLLEDPTMSIRGNFSDSRTGERSNKNLRNILAAADEELGLAKEELSKSDVLENKAIDSVRATLGKEIAKLDKQIEKDKKAEEEAKIAPQVQYLLRGDRLELRAGKKAPFRNQDVKDFLDDSGFEWNDSVKAETKSGMDEAKARDFLRQLKDRFGIDLLPREGQPPIDLDSKDESVVVPETPEAPEAPSAEPKEKTLREREDDEFQKFLFPDGIPAGWTLRKEGAYNEVYYTREITNENGDRIVGTYAKDGDREPSWLLDMQSEDKYPDINSLQEALDYVDNKSGAEEATPESPVEETPAVEEPVVETPEAPTEETPSPEGPSDDFIKNLIEVFYGKIGSFADYRDMSPEEKKFFAGIQGKGEKDAEQILRDEASKRGLDWPTDEEIAQWAQENKELDEEILNGNKKRVLNDLVSERRRIQDAIDEADLSTEVQPEEKQALKDALDELTRRIDAIVLGKPVENTKSEDKQVIDEVLGESLSGDEVPTVEELVEKLKEKSKEKSTSFGSRKDMISKLMWFKWGAGFAKNESPYIQKAMKDYKKELNKLSDQDMIDMLNLYYDEMDAEIADQNERSERSRKLSEARAKKRREREDKLIKELEEESAETTPATPATPDVTPEATAPEAAKPMKTSVRGADLKPGDVTTKDFFTITNVEGGHEKPIKGVKVPASIVSGYYPGSEEQSSKLWADDTMFEVYRGVTPPEKGDLPELRQPRKEDYADRKDYIKAKEDYDKDLESRKAKWTAPEVETAPEPASPPKTGPHIISDKAKNLKPNDISFVENKETGELEQFFVITEVLEGTVDYTRPDNGKVEKKTIVRGYYPGHQIQENDWNEDTNISVIRGDAPENLPQPGDKPAIERIANGTLKGKAYSEKRAEITAARTEAGKGYTSPIGAADVPAARIESKPWRPDRPAFLGSAAELAKLGDGAAISEALKGKRVLVMDFETVGTGDFDYDNPDAPIQVAGAIYENGEKVDEINLFMNPGAPLSNWYYMTDKDGNRVIDPAKLLKSGDETVTDEWLATQPSIAEQLQKFAEFAGPDAIWVAHNAEFDTNTFEKWAAKSGVDYTIPGVIDTVVIARSNYGQRGNKLKELAEKFGIDVSAEDLHNAATDIRILNPILEKLLLDMKPGNKQFDVPVREAEHASRLAKHNRDMATWKAQMAADKVKTKPEFGPEGTTDEAVNYVHTSIFGDQINEAWMLDDENTYAVNGGGTVLVDELREGDFIEGKGGYVEIVDIQVDPENKEKLLVFRRDPRTGDIVYERIEDSSTPGVGWSRTRPIKFGEVRRRNDFKDKSASEIKSLIPEATPDNPEPQVAPESDPVKGEEVSDEQATKVISDALETISLGSKSDSTVDDAIKDLNVDETIKTQVLDREGGSDYHLDANGTPLAIGDRVRNVKNGRVGTIRTLIEEFGKDKRKNYLKVKFDDREKRENAAAGSLEIIREDDGDSVLEPEPTSTEMGMSLPEEVTSRGLVASRIDPTDLKVGDRLDISGKTRVSAVSVGANDVSVGTKTRGSRGGGFASFPKTELVKVWRKPEDTPDSPVGMALPDMGAEIYEMAPPSDEGAGIPNALPEDNYEYAGEKFPPTAEQRNVLTAIMTGDDVVVRALAGTGKTSTLTLAARRLLEEDPKKKIVYVAFNKTVQEEAQGKMPSNVEARTGDSIAFQSVDSKITKKFKGQRDKNSGVTMKLRAEDISDELGIKPTSVKMKGSVVNLSSREIPSYVKQAVNNFAISADEVLGAKHFSEELDEVPRSFVEYANGYWDDITNPSGVFSINNAHITKIWALSNPDLGAAGSGLKTPADVIFFDEAQDINPVIAKVIADQKIQKVYVGDGNQAIYAFRGAEDQLDKTTATWDLPLTKSFRFGPEIAGIANRFLAQLDSKYRVEGAGSKGEVVEETMTDPDVVITRTNSGGFRAMIELLDAGKVVGITKGTKDELESLVKSASWLIGNQKFGKPTMHPDLAEFKNWTEVKEAVEKGEGKKVKALYDLVVQNGIASIKDILDRVKVVTSDENKVDLKPSTSFKKLTLDQAVDGAKGLVGEGINYEIKGTAIRLSGNGTFRGKDTIKDQKFRWDPTGKQWYKEVEDDLDRQDAINELRRAVGGFAPEGGQDSEEIDVVVTTAHKSKGLQWDNVRIFDDFWGPRVDKKTGKLELPSDEELRLAYVALTRAQKKLDPGPLNWIKEYTEDSDELPKLPTPAEQEMGMALPTENVTEEKFNEDTLATAEKVDPATEQIADAIIAALEAGTAPWRKPWSGGGFLPTSVATGKMYEGSNVLVLWAAQEKNGWTDNRWLTYKQAEKLGGNIKRGEKGTKIIHWTPITKEVEKPDGTKEKVFVYRPPKTITVFNVQQAENINLPQPTMNEPVPVTEAETTLLDSYKDKPQIFNVSQDQAYYTQVEDVIKLPLREQFANPQDYFETLVHELAHSTGHRSRVGRSDLLDNYGTHKASRGEEELIAEISVSLAAARLGVEIDFGNVAAYAKGWLSVLQNDKTMIVKAARQAQKAVDYMLGKQPTPEAAVDEEGNPIGSGVGSEGKTGEEIAKENK